LSRGYQLYRTSCRQKVAFRTREEAEAKARSVHEYGEELTAYLCVVFAITIMWGI